jgi:hypothetical protein
MGELGGEGMRIERLQTHMPIRPQNKLKFGYCGKLLLTPGLSSTGDLKYTGRRVHATCKCYATLYKGYVHSQSSALTLISKEAFSFLRTSGLWLAELAAFPLFLLHHAVEKQENTCMHTEQNLQHSICAAGISVHATKVSKARLPWTCLGCSFLVCVCTFLCVSAVMHVPWHARGGQRRASPPTLRKALAMDFLLPTLGKLAPGSPGNPCLCFLMPHRSVGIIDTSTMPLAST